MEKLSTRGLEVGHAADDQNQINPNFQLVNKPSWKEGEGALLTFFLFKGGGGGIREGFIGDLPYVLSEIVYRK